MSKYRVPISTAVVCLLLVSITYLAFGPVPLTAVEQQTVMQRIEGEQSYFLEMKAQRDLFRTDRLLITVKMAQPYPQWPEKIQITYDRNTQTIITAKTISSSATLAFWLVSLLAALGLSVFTWLYIRPVVAGHYCPHCRTYGFFPVVLKDTERELFRPTLGKDGQLFPSILETEWVCPLCHFTEYKVHSPAQQDEDSNLFGRMVFAMHDSQANVHPYASDKELENTVMSFAAKMDAEGITEEIYHQRCAEAERSAHERSDRREED